MLNFLSLSNMSWYKEVPVENRTIFQCRTKTELIELLDYLTLQGYTVMCDGNVEVETKNNYRATVAICCSAGREYREYYGVFQTIGDRVFLDGYRLGTFDGNPKDHPYIKEELENLTTIIYDLLRTNPERFTKKGTTFYLNPADPMYE